SKRDWSSDVCSSDLNLFKGSGSFTQVSENEFDVLIVDEAHRLNEKSGLFQNMGENQMKELISGANLSIFFIDEHQKVTIQDVGSIETIEYYAKEVGAKVSTYELHSQFRCDGSDGYIAWLDDVLEIRETANVNDLGMDYDIQVFDNPNDMLKAIEEKNKENNKSRIMAGYCWDWPKKTRNDPTFYDITIPEYDFEMSWNIENTWAIEEQSVKEAGSIHTAQGLEFDYAGVIIGDDLRYEDGKIITDHTKRARTDQSLKGIKGMAKNDPDKAYKVADPIIKNTYRNLLTRRQKGCYIYCTDKNLSNYIKDRISKMYKYRQEREQILYLKENN